MDVLTVAWLIAGGVDALALIVYHATRRGTDLAPIGNTYAGCPGSPRPVG